MSIKNRLEQLKQKKKEIVENATSTVGNVSQDFLLEASRIVNTVKQKLNDIPEWFSLENDMQIDIVKKFVSEEIKDDKFLGINLDGLISKILSQVNGYGVLDNIINDEEIDKIFVNSTNYVLVQKKREVVKVPLKFETEPELLSTVKRILSLASIEFTNTKYFYEGKLPDNMIFNIVMPPISASGITLTIEKLKNKNIDFERLIQSDFLSFETAKFLEEAMQNSKNILIAGELDIGKKILLNAMSQKIPLTKRTFCISDYKTVLTSQDNFINFDISNIQNNKAELHKLFETVVEQRPDAIVLPTCQGHVAYEILRAANICKTGMLTSILATSATDAMERFLGQIIALNTGIDRNILQKRLANVFDYVVFIGESSVAKTVEISEIVKDKDGNLKLKNILTEKTMQKKPVTTKKTTPKIALKK